jgi:hypothetical protein
MERTLKFNTEPVAIAAAVRAVLVAAVAFGLEMSGEQIAALVVAIEIVGALFVRSKVTPTSKIPSSTEVHP